MASQLSTKEFTNIWEPMGSFRPFSQIFKQAVEKGKLNLLYFAQSNLAIIFCTLLLIVICFTYLRSLKKMYKERELLKEDLDGQLVLRYPLLSALVIITNLAQFLFGSSPFIFNLIFWIVSGLSLSILFRGFITRYWMRIWLLLFSFFLLVAVDNLILQATRLERWVMLLLAGLGVLAGLIVFRTKKKNELKEKLIFIQLA